MEFHLTDDTCHFKLDDQEYASCSVNPTNISRSYIERHTEMESLFHSLGCNSTYLYVHRTRRGDSKISLGSIETIITHITVASRYVNTAGISTRHYPPRQGLFGVPIRISWNASIHFIMLCRIDITKLKIYFLNEMFSFQQ